MRGDNKRGASLEGGTIRGELLYEGGTITGGLLLREGQ